MIKRTIIKPATDEPVTFLLDGSPEGKQTQSPNGSIDYQYIVNNDRAILWLPASARNQLLRTGAQAGDQIQIVKGSQGHWSVRVLSDAAEPAAYTNGRTNGHPAAAPKRGTSQLAQCLCAAVDAAVEASEYARSQNFSVTFLGSDIRAMANSLMINDERGAR